MEATECVIYLLSKAGKCDRTLIEEVELRPGMGPEVPTGHYISWNVLPRRAPPTGTTQIPCKVSINSPRLHLRVPVFTPGETEVPYFGVPAAEGLHVPICKMGE